MSLLKRAYLEEGIDNTGLEEENYMRLFNKMGRDFIHRDDFVYIINQILDLLGVEGLKDIDLQSRTEAVKKALVYKNYIASAIHIEQANDLINLDED